MDTTAKSNSRAHRANLKFREAAGLHSIVHFARLQAEAEEQHCSVVVLVKDGEVTEEGRRRGIKL